MALTRNLLVDKVVDMRRLKTRYSIYLCFVSKTGFTIER